MAVRGFVRMEYLLSPVPGATKPSAPVVTVSKVAGETTHLAVSWSYPFDGGLVITDYDVQLQEEYGAMRGQSWPHTGTGRTTTITGLEATAHTRCRCGQRTRKGTGLWSESGVGHTDC